MTAFRTLRGKLVLFLVALLGVVQVAEFTLTSRASYHAARAKIEDELEVAERVFARVLEQTADQQAQAAAVLASDFAFREAVATGDRGTLEDALANHGARIHAQALLYLDLRGTVVADTLSATRHGPQPDLGSLIGRAREHGQARDVAVLEGHAFQLIALPVRAPITIGFIVVCFPIDAVLARDLRQLTGLDISFVVHEAAGWRVLASTLAAEHSAALPQRLGDLGAAHAVRHLDLPGGEQQVRILPLGSGSGAGQVAAVLQRPTASALAQFRSLRQTLLVLGALSLALSVLGSVLIALGITRPLSVLLAAVQRIRHGDYSAPIPAARPDEVGLLAQGIEHMRDGIAERERRILKLAYEDPLTRLPNRARFGEELARGVPSARTGRSTLAVMIMDLDRFKYVNDTLGHGVGDYVLCEVGARLRLLVGESGCVARLGGDEFAVLVHGLRRAEVEVLAARIVAALEHPILFEDQPLDVGASIGIALFPEHANEPERLVRNADIAMYVAKRDKAGYSLYEPSHDTNQQEHLSLLSELRRAVDAGELRLYYQPKVTLASSAVVAVEGLLRWLHPTRGLVPPGLFIPFAEHTGYIKVLTRWVIGEAVRQCGEWRREGLDLCISVNISARDLMARDLPELISAALARHEVPASRLCLEITESGFMEDPAHAQKVLDALAGIGVLLSIDDYGTGYSSLSYLMRLPVEELKIDRSFVARMSEERDLATIVRSTIELGHSLGLKVVAEGVETSEGFRLLRDLGCDSAQGYFMSPPLAPDALRDWLEGRLPAPRAQIPALPRPTPQEEPGGTRIRARSI